MGIGSKYTTVGCGCGAPTCNTCKKYGASCCQTTVQTAPSPCCESHDTVYKAGVCLTPTCDVVATDGEFNISFSNLCDDLTINATEVFFYNAATGFMRIVGVTGNGIYTVSLLDPAKAGGVIAKGGCVYVSAFPVSVTEGSSTNRCLSGEFVTPAENASQTMYITNGQSIPIGSTLTLVYNGEQGSYLVTAYISASGSTYAYTVQNTGNGLVPGQIISGGLPGQCLIPIEVVTEIDFCNLSESNTADSFTACLNGAARAFVPTGPKDIPIGDADGKWTLGKLNSVDCCVVIDECLKFNGSVCDGGCDTVTLRDVNLACFGEAWDAVTAADPSGGGQGSLSMNIDGFPVVVRGYNAETKEIDICPADPDALAEVGSLTYDAGTQICLGDCCASCILGPQTTNFQLTTDNTVCGEECSATYSLGFEDIAYETGTQHLYLIGYEYDTTPLAVEQLEITSTWDDDPGPGPGLPRVTDPMVFRSKICNQQGCDQIVDIEWRYELAMDVIPANVRVDWEIGNIITQSATLEDGTTPNPFSSNFTTAKARGSILGPTDADASSLIGTSYLGFGGPGSPKWFPSVAGYFKNQAYLEKCNCLLSVVWLFLRTEVLSGTLDSVIADGNLTITQSMRFYNANEILMARNNPSAETWAA